MPEAPCSFSKIINIIDGAQRVVATAIYGRKVILTGFPLAAATNIFVGYDNTVSPTNFAFALRGGDLHVDESSGPYDRRTPSIFYIAVEGDATGLMVGVE